MKQIEFSLVQRLFEERGSNWSEVARISSTEDVLSFMMCRVDQTLSAKPLSLVNSDFKKLTKKPQANFCLESEIFFYHTYHDQRTFLIIKISFHEHQLTLIFLV